MTGLYECQPFGFYFKLIGIALILTLLLLGGCVDNKDNTGLQETNYVQYVNPFIGTGGEGHSYPGATVPFGMVQLSPDTEIKHFTKSFPWCAGYRYNDSTILGFSHTHFSGTGHSDMGDFLVMPMTGPLRSEPGSADEPDMGYRSRFSHEKEYATPGYYSVELNDYDIKAELTTTERVGFHRYTFPAAEEAYILLDLISSIYNFDDKVAHTRVQILNDTTIVGMRLTNGWAPDRQLYFAMVFSTPFEEYAVIRGNQREYKGFGKKEDVLKDYPEVSGKKLKIAFKYNFDQDEQLLIKTGISAVDERGALLNLGKEIPGWDFELVREEASYAWEKELSKVTVDGTERQKQIFYTALYHSFLAPVKYYDVDRRYRGLDKQIHTCNDFDNYTIFSLWDTYRALHPLFTILQPERDGQMIHSMIKHQQQHAFGVLPVWSFHGNETWCMIGYHSVPVIADAYLKGIRNYPIDEAFEAVYESAVYGSYDGLEYYMNYNYVPIDLENEGASKTLEYAYDDWTIARMAEAMGNRELSRYFDFRAISFRNIFDPKTGFMRARMSNGKFREPFDPFYAQYGGDYTEGNAWQYSWYVPHDPKGLIELMGGEDKFTEKLDSLFILEVSDEKFRHVEDIAGLMGQYAHGNEPSHHIAYLYNYAGKPWKTQKKVRKIVDTFFDNTPEGLCGNEDCGQMSAWYIFSAMGFYPVCPGSNEYVIGSPSLPEVTLHLDNGNEFHIESRSLSDENIYVQSVMLNGKALERCFIRHDEIMAGGELIFIMAAEPNKEWASGPEARPYSHSDYFSLEDYYK